MKKEWNDWMNGFDQLVRMGYNFRYVLPFIQFNLLMIGAVNEWNEQMEWRSEMRWRGMKSIQKSINFKFNYEAEWEMGNSAIN